MRLSGSLAVFYPPVSVEQDHIESVYVSKGSRLELRCALEHRGYPEVGGERERERCLGVLTGGGRGLVEGRDQDQERVRVEDSGGERRSGGGQELHLHPFQPGEAIIALYCCTSLLYTRRSQYEYFNDSSQNNKTCETKLRIIGLILIGKCGSFLQ